MLPPSLPPCFPHSGRNKRGRVRVPERDAAGGLREVRQRRTGGGGGVRGAAGCWAAGGLGGRHLELGVPEGKPAKAPTPGEILALDVKVILTTLYNSLAILYKKYTVWRDNDLTSTPRRLRGRR